MTIKKPLHPGRVADHLFQAEGHESNDTFCCECLNGQKLHTRSNLRLISDKMNYPINIISRLVCGDKDIDYFLAYKLVKVLPHTTMEFWLNLQQMYDYYKSVEEIKIREDLRNKQEQMLAQECRNLENQDRYKIDEDDLHQMVDWINTFAKQGSIHGNLSWELSDNNTIRLFGLMGLGLPAPDYYKGKAKNES